MKENVSLRPFIIFCLVIILLWAASEYVIYKNWGSWQERGTFGDAFGAINSLFSGLAFAGIIYTILLQRQELRLQREELADTRIELKRAADAQEKSEQALTLQIKSMKTTAKLNGYNAILEYYNSKAQTQVSRGRTGTVELNLAGQYAKKIQDLLDELEK